MEDGNPQDDKVRQEVLRQPSVSEGHTMCWILILVLEGSSKLVTDLQRQE